ncbi:hypothetical protein H1C71_011630, partial [Ictidomys tridecemlineatus]
SDLGKLFTLLLPLAPDQVTAPPGPCPGDDEEAGFQVGIKSFQWQCPAQALPVILAPSQVVRPYQCVEVLLLPEPVIVPIVPSCPLDCSLLQSFAHPFSTF